MSEQKKANKWIVIISAAIVALLVLAVISALIFPDMIAGNILLSKTREGIDKSDVVVLSDPSYNQSTLPISAQRVVEGEEVAELAEQVLSVTEKVSYKSAERSVAGFWDVNMRFDDGNESYTVYLREDCLYVVKNNTAYLFNIDKSVKEEYNILYEKVISLILESVENAQ